MTKREDNDDDAGGGKRHDQGHAEDNDDEPGEDDSMNGTHRAMAIAASREHCSVSNSNNRGEQNRTRSKSPSPGEFCNEILIIIFSGVGMEGADRYPPESCGKKLSKC